jgi:hypothetical protein
MSSSGTPQTYADLEEATGLLTINNPQDWFISEVTTMIKFDMDATNYYEKASEVLGGKTSTSYTRVNDACFTTETIAHNPALV